jgi:hypothetical protein
VCYQVIKGTIQKKKVYIYIYTGWLRNDFSVHAHQARTPRRSCAWTRRPARLGVGGKVIKCKSPLNVRKDTYDDSCYRARSDEYQRLMTVSPAARRDAPLPRHRVSVIVPRLVVVRYCIGAQSVVDAPLPRRRVSSIPSVGPHRPRPGAVRAGGPVCCALAAVSPCCVTVL